MKNAPRVLILLYVLLAYVFVQFAWWAYLIYDLNLSLFAAVPGGDSGELLSKLWMVIGEGSVFLLLLLVGAYYIRNSILRERRLARQEKNFLLATTHEFNSPIAAIKLNLQTLSKREVSPEQKKSIVVGALGSTQRLELLVTNILTASRLDAGKFELLKERVALHDLVSMLKLRYEALMLDAGCTMDLSQMKDAWLYADRAAMETMLGNLIENAIKYAPGCTLYLGIDSDDDQVRIFVADSGKGIPEDEGRHIFKKFYRIENEETRSKKGSGLGLFLVKELVDLHGGHISVGAHKPSGLKVALTFKKQEKDDQK